MVISSLIIETKREFTDAVAAQAAARPGIEVHGIDPDTGKIVITIEAESTEASHKAASELIPLEGVLGLDLVYANFEDENLNR